MARDGVCMCVVTTFTIIIGYLHRAAVGVMHRAAVAILFYFIYFIYSKTFVAKPANA